jgi:hypothetical protein
MESWKEKMPEVLKMGLSTGKLTTETYQGLMHFILKRKC